MSKLDAEEQQILDAFHLGKLKRVKNTDQVIEFHKSAAKATLMKASINIRLSSRDIRALKALGLQEGIPYQTLAASVLHKFANGQLVEKNSGK